MPSRIVQRGLPIEKASRNPVARARAGWTRQGLRYGRVERASSRRDEGRLQPDLSARLLDLRAAISGALSPARLHGPLSGLGQLLQPDAVLEGLRRNHRHAGRRQRLVHEQLGRPKVGVGRFSGPRLDPLCGRSLPHGRVATGPRYRRAFDGRLRGDQTRLEVPGDVCRGSKPERGPRERASARADWTKSLTDPEVKKVTEAD